VDAQLIVDYGHLVAAHLAGAGSVVDGRALLPCILQEFVVARDMGAREDLGAAILGESRGGEEPADESEPADDRPAIGLLAQVPGIDCRRFSGIIRFGLDVTT